MNDDATLLPRSLAWLVLMAISLPLPSATPTCNWILCRFSPSSPQTPARCHICSSAEARSRLLTAMVADQEAVSDDHLLSSALAVSIDSI